MDQFTTQLIVRNYRSSVHSCIIVFHRKCRESSLHFFLRKIRLGSGYRPYAQKRVRLVNYIVTSENK